MAHISVTVLLLLHVHDKLKEHLEYTLVIFWVYCKPSRASLYTHEKPEVRIMTYSPALAMYIYMRGSICVAIIKLIINQKI